MCENHNKYDTAKLTPRLALVFALLVFGISIEVGTERECRLDIASIPYLKKIEINLQRELFLHQDTSNNEPTHQRAFHRR